VCLNLGLNKMDPAGIFLMKRNKDSWLLGWLSSEFQCFLKPFLGKVFVLYFFKFFLFIFLRNCMYRSWVCVQTLTT
jgi:hypothetical protein